MSDVVGENGTVTVIKALLSVAVCFQLILLAIAESLPMGTAVSVRMDTKITSGAKAGETVAAVVVAPVLIGDRVLLPQGARVAGSVKSATPAKPDARAELLLDFTELTLDQGADLELSLTKALELAADYLIEKVTPIEPAAELAALVDAIPFQTTAGKLEKPSDVTNLMYIGTREQIEAAFQAAGWAAAAELNAVSGLQTMRAVAEQRGYKEAPMSTLLLEGRPPDLVFQKQYNTFAKRHQLRISQRAEKFQGREVWVRAATHDTGIDFSPENRTFIHKIDSQIDHKGAKVVFDLMFADKVQAVALVERPKVPTSGENATGDKIETDGKMAVLVLR
jgi:hypothetical protein